MEANQAYSRMVLLNLKPTEKEDAEDAKSTKSKNLEIQIANASNGKEADFWQRLEPKRKVTYTDDELVFDENNGLKEFRCEPSRLVRQRSSDGVVATDVKSVFKNTRNGDDSKEYRYVESSRLVRKRASDSASGAFMDNRENGPVGAVRFHESLRFNGQSPENRSFRKFDRPNSVPDQYPERVDMLGPAFFFREYGAPTLNERFSFIRRGYALQLVKHTDCAVEKSKDRSISLQTLDDFLRRNSARQCSD